MFAELLNENSAEMLHLKDAHDWKSNEVHCKCGRDVDDYGVSLKHEGRSFRRIRRWNNMSNHWSRKHLREWKLKHWSLRKC